MATQREIFESLRGLGYRPNARLGQNFLFDPKLLEAFLDDAAVEHGESVLEVGPGAGTLTERMLARGCRVLAAEIDPRLCEYLRTRFVSELNSGALILWQGDALAKKSELAIGLSRAIDDFAPRFRLIANLPYAIATPLLHAFLQRGTFNSQSEMTGLGVLLQKELADRWIAQPGSGDYGPTAIALSLYGHGRITRKVGRKLFIPPPKVDSAFLVWGRQHPLDQEYSLLMELARRLFSQRRKMLRALLKGDLDPMDRWWVDSGVAPESRPEALSPQSLRDLAQRLVQG